MAIDSWVVQMKGPTIPELWEKYGTRAGTRIALRIQDRAVRGIEFP
jgi:hypothetical protein